MGVRVSDTNPETRMATPMVMVGPAGGAVGGGGGLRVGPGDPGGAVVPQAVVDQLPEGERPVARIRAAAPRRLGVGGRSTQGTLGAGDGVSPAISGVAMQP